MIKFSQLFIRNICRILFIIAIACFCGCDDEPGGTEVNSDHCDCNCTGEYNITGWSIPNQYNCATESEFEVSLKTSIDTCYHGLSVLWFELRDDVGNVYKSNFTSFDGERSGTFFIFFGGSIPSGTYWIYGRMMDIQDGCTDSICVNVEKPLGQIDVYECPPPTKTMNIEYTYQYDTPEQKSYDLFQSPTLEHKISIAFEAAQTGHHFFAGVPSPEGEYIIDSDGELRKYIGVYKISWEMFLCGIKGFADIYGNYLPYIAGKATYDSLTHVPDTATGSVVAVKACNDATSYHSKLTVDDFIDAVTIHELGHQRAITGHCFSTWCIMQPSTIDFGLINITRLWNPYFCHFCISEIENITW